MIIGISGKIRSGKDTVAKLIQLWDYTRKNGFSAVNVDAILTDNFVLTTIQNNPSYFTTRRFAGKLKNHVADLLDIDTASLENQDVKASKLGPEWNKLLPAAVNEKVPMTIRDLLIAIGDGARNYVHPDIWVNGLFNQYKGENWIVPDMRYPNEHERITKLAGKTIRVNRPGLKNIDHYSEIALDVSSFDYVIENDKSLNELYAQVKTIMDDITRGSKKQS